MKTMTKFQTRTLSVPAGSLYYEVRGAGPVLLMMPGGPADATTFRKIEDRLATRYTVVTYDPRGLSHSSPFDARDDSRMGEIFADDAHRLLDEVGEGKADIFASSGGAVIAMDLIKNHPDEVKTAVLHEPPAPDFLSDPVGIRAAMADVCDTCAREGVWPAAGEFLKLVGGEGRPPPAAGGGPPPGPLQGLAVGERKLQ